MQVKEPTASILRTLVHHSTYGLMKVKRLHQRCSKHSVFLIDHNHLVHFMNIWSKSNEISQKEWLLYYYLNVCLDFTQAIPFESIWATDTSEFVHCEWKVDVSHSESLSYELQKRILELCPISDIQFDSAPWSLSSFLQTKWSSIRTITEHPWWIRQELCSHTSVSTPNSKRLSFSLPPPIVEVPEQTSHPLSIQPRTSPPSKANTFPVIRGSMIHSPNLKQYDNHLASQKRNTEQTIVHRMIRISTGFLR